MSSMVYDWLRLYWDWRGRISRSNFWFGQFSLWTVYLSLFGCLDRLVGYQSTLVLCPPMLWALFSLMAKRFHDRNKSPVWVVIILLPVLGPIWCLIELGFLPGTAAENRFGLSRKAAASRPRAVR